MEIGLALMSQDILWAAVSPQIQQVEEKKKKAKKMLVWWQCSERQKKSFDVCTDVILQFKPERRQEIVETIKKL